MQRSDLGNPEPTNDREGGVRLMNALRHRKPLIALGLPVLAALFALLAVSVVNWTQADGGTPFVALDATTGDNTDTSYGTITDCFEAAASTNFTADVVIGGVSDLVAFQLTLNYPAGAVPAGGRSVATSMMNNEVPDAGGSAAIDTGASSTLPNVTGADTAIVSNDNAIGSGGASGDGLLIRYTVTSPAAAGIYSLTLTGVTLNDAFANEIAVDHVHNADLQVGDPTPDGSCVADATPTPTQEPSGVGSPTCRSALCTWSTAISLANASFSVTPVRVSV